jgi:predicted outer membrane repeat protein
LDISFMGAIVVGSSILDNQVDSSNVGAGVYAEYYPLTLLDSTISGNFGASQGGGIYSDNGVLDLLNSTVSGNTASTGGGIYSMDGTVALNYSTIADNHGSSAAGGLYNESVTTIENSILAGNQANSSPAGNAADCQALDPITFGGYSLFGGGTGCSGDGLTDQSVSPANVFTSVLEVIADNGGGTQTHALTPGCPALDAIPSGTNGCSTSIDEDQRGVSRPQAGSCDIGAFEAQEQPFSITFTGGGSGSVSSTSPDLSCSSDCTQSLGYGLTLTLTAVADLNSTFDGWGGDCSGTDDCILAMTEARSVSASFNSKPAGPMEVFLPIIQK